VRESHHNVRSFKISPHQADLVLYACSFDSSVIACSPKGLKVKRALLASSLFVARTNEIDRMSFKIEKATVGHGFVSHSAIINATSSCSCF